MIDEKETNADSNIITTAQESLSMSERQRARAFLRERFLRVVTGIVGKEAEFHLHEKTHIIGEFRGCSVGFSEIFVRNLETPIGKVPEAILRSGDITYLNINGVNVNQ